MKVLREAYEPKRLVIEDDDDLGLVMFSCSTSPSLIDSERFVRRVVSKTARQNRDAHIQLRGELGRIRLIRSLVLDPEPITLSLSPHSSSLAIMAIQECVAAQLIRDSDHNSVGYMPEAGEFSLINRCIAALDVYEAPHDWVPLGPEINPNTQY